MKFGGVTCRWSTLPRWRWSLPCRSGASNGVIHMRTAWRVTSLKHLSVHSMRSTRIRIPRAGDGGTTAIRRCPTAVLAARQKFGKVDLVAGGNMLSDKTYLSVGHEQRMRANFKLRYRHSPLWQFGGGSKANASKWVDSSSGTTSSRMLTCPWKGRSAKTVGSTHVDAWKRTPMSGGSHHRSEGLRNGAVRRAPFRPWSVGSPCSKIATCATSVTIGRPRWVK